MKEPIASAFLSCSLRKEDEYFINYVSSILVQHGIKPFGTVGKLSASPENPTTLMRKNIPKADMLVIAATPRYLQEDIQNGKRKNTLSEMIHVEAGMAFALNKPVVVFTQPNTDVGNFLPNITQYVTLTGTKEDFHKQKALIFSLLNCAYLKVKSMKEDTTLRKVGNVIVGGLAVYGAYKLIDSFFKE